MKITRLDHVQLAMPPGGEEMAREFYGRILHLRELEKPEPLKAKGGCWFAGEGVELHLGAQADRESNRNSNAKIRFMVPPRFFGCYV